MLPPQKLSATVTLDVDRESGAVRGFVFADEPVVGPKIVYQRTESLRLSIVRVKPERFGIFAEISKLAGEALLNCVKIRVETNRLIAFGLKGLDCNCKRLLKIFC